MTVYEPMKFKETSLSDVGQYAMDDSYVFEQKLDGTRGLAVVTERGVWWPGRGGRGALAHTAATQHLPKINPILREMLGDREGEIIFDGEILTDTGEFRIFDLPSMIVEGYVMVRPTDSLAVRRSALDVGPAQFESGGPVRLVRQARTEQDKLGLYLDVFNGGGEGVMIKHLGGRYLPGKRSSDMFKAKFVKTADVVVTHVDRPDARHGSARLGVFAPSGQLVEVGGCSLIGKPAVEIGDVVEVKYLYMTDAAQLYQARMVRTRPDKHESECTFGQFRVYSKAVV